ncbi:G patch domain-containing protein 1 homolog [Calliphora vicina]|uniref:G patch domain-containing protein 1 homolog n=1 Tax=Calliphora vicina TaxID=7373 RepID=UPI00325B8A90
MFSEQNLHKFGTSLPLLELDQVPSKKPLYVQDQIATDEQGRRRFHGAFTGGFSAGYWNTVGSKEGWTPQAFKSSRSEKATEKLSQRPEDFMDEEDRGEFGIAPKTIKINEDFSSGPEQAEKRKRKFLQNDLQPIPGEPVLQQLIKPIKDKAAVRILKTWGWRPGQGIGPRQTRKEKKKARERNKKELYLMEKYGCEMPSTSSKAALNTDEEDEEEDDETEEEEDEITFAPEDCELPPCYDKQNSYGIGYEPLSRKTVLGGNLMVKPTEHINLFQALEAVGKNNQKISFTGQAFGVGALEEDDDEDVYALDDMTRYDYTLEDKKTKKIKKKVSEQDDLVFGEFILDLNASKLPAYKVEIPFGWHPRNWYEKRSRFEPLDPRKQRHLDKVFSNTSAEQEMTREKRAELLGEELRKTQQSLAKPEPPKELKSKSVEELQQEYKDRKEKTKTLIEKITAKSSSFTKGGIISIEGEEKAFTEEDITTAFKPFAANEPKQKRYEQFLAKEFKNEQEIQDFLKTIQPVELSLWDRQMELKEFQQAKKLYRPLKGIMSDRFITESEIKFVEKETKKVENKQIVVERSKQMWKPHSLLCKRFNIAEPFKGLLEDDKKSKTKHKKLSVFDYLETSVNKKEDFQTPVIIPKHIEKPQEMVKQTNEGNTETIVEIQQEATPLEWQEVLNPPEKSLKEKQTFTFKPKTDLEKQVLESINKPVAEKKELFKSIFSDSESEEDEQEEEDKQNKAIEELKAAISKPLNAAAANLLRNNSPPRGIFKALFSTTTASQQETEKEPEKETTNSPAKNNPNLSPENLKVLFKPKSAREPKEQQNDLQSSTDIYGPALPCKTLTSSQTLEASTLKSSIDEKLLQLFNKHKPKLQVTEKWIEKDSKNDTEDESEDSDSSSSSEDTVQHKKKTKKSKKKKSSDHKHKKHKDNKSSKKSRKLDKKKKKHKKK